MPRPARICIDLAALQHNQAVVRRYAPRAQMVCCVKANAYGHGLVEAARALAPAADALAVASIDEAQALRQAGLTLPILLLAGCFDAGEVAQLGTMNLWTVVHNQTQLDSLCALGADEPVHLWLKLDTGMHRLGFAPDAVVDACARLRAAGWREGQLRLMTHFACADELENNFTRVQMELFAGVAHQLSLATSLANSPAIIGWPDSHGDWVRPGFMLYGLSPFGNAHPSAAELVPAMSFESEVISVRAIGTGEAVGYNRVWQAKRQSEIATVAVGYGDGYPRNVRTGTPVLVNGRRAPIVGRVSMDLMTVDVTDIGPVQPGDQVELWGKNLSASEIARHSDYSAYELLTRMPQRARREFIS